MPVISEKQAVGLRPRRQAAPISKRGYHSMILEDKSRKK
jgi:hypothetical protein